MRSFQGRDTRRNICGRRIREERKKQGFTQDTLAKAMKAYHVTLDQKTISLIELQERVVADFELLAFAQVLQVGIMELLEIEPE